MSVESNIASFRGKGGLWEKYDPEEYAHISTLRHHPEKAWILLGAMQQEITKAKPNQGHYALAELERLGFLKTILHPGNIGQVDWLVVMNSYDQFFDRICIIEKTAGLHQGLFIGTRIRS